MSEKLSLKWNDFPDITSTAFGGLRNDTDFSDVTLACEDGQQVEAHKVILAAFSPFFQKLLRRNKHPHPLIYMRGVKSEDLVAIVDFLYYGEANVYQENIDAFLAIAEELKLKGLTGNKDETNRPDSILSDDKIEIDPLIIQPKNEHSTTQERIYEQSLTTEKIGTALAVQSYEVSHVNITDVQELDAKVKSMMTKSQNILPNRNRKADICTVCGKEGDGSIIRDHIEANHLEGVSLPCNYCGKKFRSRDYLKHHMRIHK